jgi:hypothetical protein
MVMSLINNHLEDVAVFTVLSIREISWSWCVNSESEIEMLFLFIEKMHGTS